MATPSDNHPDQKKTWSDLTEGQRRAVVVSGILELVLTVLAIRDLVRRPQDGVRGPKAAWVASFVVQPIGPIAYFLFGRR
jgi:hypothetical protein